MSKSALNDAIFLFLFYVKLCNIIFLYNIILSYLSFLFLIHRYPIFVLSSFYRFISIFRGKDIVIAIIYKNGNLQHILHYISLLYTR